MELDRHRLNEEREWRLANYRKQVRQLVSALVDAIQHEAKRVLDREITYDDDKRSEYSYVDQAGQLQHAILQAVNNADFGGLTRDAGDLHAVEMGLHTLAKLKAQLPVEVRELVERTEDQRQLELLESVLADEERRAREQEERCRAGVHQGGRGVGFHQCQRKGSKTVVVDGRPGYLGQAPKKTTDTVEMKLCGTHAAEFERRGNVHIFRPSDWDANQIAAGRQKKRAQIERLKASLPLQLTEGEK